MHHDDYTVFTSPLDDFRAAVAEADLDTRVHYLARGEHLHLTLAHQRR